MISNEVALIAAPTTPVLMLDEVKRHLVVTFSDDDALIQEMIDAVVGQIDPAAGGWLGRALRPQIWELRRSAFAHHPRDPYVGEQDTFAIELPYPPLISIVSVKYTDAFGIEQTLDPSLYRVLRKGGRGRQLLAPAFGQCWPTARCTQESVRIRYICGYPAPTAADGETPAILETLPAPIKAWLKLNIGSLYQNRETFVVGRETVVELPPHILQMITPYRGY